MLVILAGLGVCAGLPGGCTDAEPGPRTSLARFQERVSPGSGAGWNLLLITLDTVRSDHVGCYGHAAARTPTIDGLAARGAQFDQAITDVPATLPAHCSIMTGLTAPRHGVRTNGHFRLHDNVTTLAEVLKGRGYATTAFVNTYVLNARYGLDAGFDNYDQHPPAGARVPQRRADAVTDAAVTWLAGHLKDHPGQPFFAWVHYFDPHAPYDPPGEFATRFADSPYDGEIAFTDANLQRLLDFLDRRDLTRRTLIVLTADHGEGLGDHLEPEHSRLIYDTTVHVPLIISCPNLHGAPCRIDDVTVGTIDVMPTALGILGIEAGFEMSGVDLTSASIGRDRAIYVETLAPLIYHGWASLHGLRRIDAKYIEAPTPEYYQLSVDPGELNNLLETDSDAAGDLADELVRTMRRWPSAQEALGTSSPLTDEARRALGALGYMSTWDPGAAPLSRLADPKDIHPVFRDIRSKEPRELHDMALAMAVSPDGDRASYRRALILAETAYERQPGSAFLATVGIARYRVGDHEAALATLDLAAGRMTPEPAWLAFRAMALAQLGRLDEAQSQLHRLRNANAAAQPDAKLLAEAESLIRQAG